MSVPSTLRYTHDHIWVRADQPDIVTIGITGTAADLTGDFVFVELPEPGARVGAGDVLGTIEALKTVIDVVAPVPGTVIEVNDALEERPGLVNAEPYGAGWVLRMQTSAELTRLLDARAYETLTIPDPVREDTA